MKRIIGYEIYGYGNDSYMTGSCDELLSELKDIPKCGACGYRTDYRYTNSEFWLKRKTLDFSATYDGITIVSLKFKEFCLRYGYTNLEFIPLPKVPNFFQFYVNNNVLSYKAYSRVNLCTKCGMYESVTVPEMNLEDIIEPLADGFYQSDLWFASRNEKSPIFVIAPKTRENFKKEGFNNICFKKIEI